MAKWARVGDVPEKIPVNFVVDSRLYPELAAWIYSFPHGSMGKTVRNILSEYAKGNPVHSEVAPVKKGSGQAPDMPGTANPIGNPVEPAAKAAQQVAVPQRQPVAIDGGTGEKTMDADTAASLNQLSQDFGQ